MLHKKGFAALRKSSPSQRRSIQPGYNRLQEDLAAFYFQKPTIKLKFAFEIAGLMNTQVNTQQGYDALSVAT